MLLLKILLYLFMVIAVKAKPKFNVGKYTIKFVYLLS